MKLLTTADQWLLHHVYQRIVDSTGLSRLWLMEVSAVAYSLFGVLLMMTMQGAWAKVFLLLVFLHSGALVIASRMPVFRCSFCEQWLRHWLLLLASFWTIVNSMLFLLGGVDGLKTVISDLMHWIVLSSHYFAACKDAPPPRKRSMSLWRRSTA
jgi:hypothetical protein